MGLKAVTFIRLGGNGCYKILEEDFTITEKGKPCFEYSFGVRSIRVPFNNLVDRFIWVAFSGPY
jgi:hypothetical protein